MLGIDIRRRSGNALAIRGGIRSIKFDQSIGTGISCRARGLHCRNLLASAIGDKHRQSIDVIYSEFVEIASYDPTRLLRTRERIGITLRLLERRKEFIAGLPRGFIEIDAARLLSE